ncbi:Polyadenylation factor subunit 2 [Fusarium oxysporum f. sp. albedinis]|nr:Polyadenylation factor subunit 2 [Fusarium oxysporum f. sp. albedinis]
MVTSRHQRSSVSIQNKILKTLFSRAAIPKGVLQLKLRKSKLLIGTMAWHNLGHESLRKTRNMTGGLKDYLCAGYLCACSS